MKILLTGGGTGGHFYPLIAIAQEINAIVSEQKLLPPQLFYLAPEPFDEKSLFEQNLTFRRSPAGKMRRYMSILNVLDVFTTAWGILKTLLTVFLIFPDVIVSKGGYASFPTVVAARFFRIPLIIHESDSKPGRVNLWSAAFAERIAISYPEAAAAFGVWSEKIAHTGNPVRRELFSPSREGAHEFLGLERQTPTILILGGSHGAARLNDAVLDALPRLLESYQVIHQTGRTLFEEVERTARVVVEKSSHETRYHPFDFLGELALRMSAGAANLVVSRAGSGAIFELAAWGLPAILVPIPEAISHDQLKNAVAYARTGAAIVVEEENLTPTLLLSEIQWVLRNAELQKKMSDAAKSFAKPQAARLIAQEAIAIALKHEKE